MLFVPGEWEKVVAIQGPMQSVIAFGWGFAAVLLGQALAESAELLRIPGRQCSNGEVVEVENADWIRFVDDYRDKSVAAYEAALTKNQDAMVDASGYLSEACLACHRVYRREPIPGDATQRCIPGPPTPPR